MKKKLLLVFFAQLFYTMPVDIKKYLAREKRDIKAHDQRLIALEVQEIDRIYKEEKKDKKRRRKRKHAIKKDTNN